VPLGELEASTLGEFDAVILVGALVSSPDGTGVGTGVIVTKLGDFVTASVGLNVGPSVFSWTGRGAEVGIGIGASVGLALCPSALPTSKSAIRSILVVRRHCWLNFVSTPILT
jgi:hypothetical protein